MAGEKNRRRLLKTIIAGTSMATATVNGKAQTNTRSINYGSKKTGIIDDGDPRYPGTSIPGESISFTGYKGDEIVFIIRSSDIDTVTYGLELPDGTMEFSYSKPISNNGWAGYASALAQDGQHTIWIRADSSGQSGEYSLFLDRTGQNHFLTLGERRTESLEKGDVNWRQLDYVNKSVPSPSYADFYRLGADAGQQVQVNVESTDFTPRVSATPRYTDSPKTDRVDGVEGPSGKQAQISHNFTKSGTLEVAVTTTDQGQTGTYRISSEQSSKNTLSRNDLDITIRNNFAGEDRQTVWKMVFDEIQESLSFVIGDGEPDEQEAYINIDLIIAVPNADRRGISYIEPIFESPIPGTFGENVRIPNVGDNTFRKQILMATRQQMNMKIIQTLALAVTALGGTTGEIDSAVSAKTEEYPDVYLRGLNLVYDDGNRQRINVDRRVPRYIDTCPQNALESILTPKRCNLRTYSESGLRDANGVAVLSPASLLVTDESGRRTGRVRTNSGWKTVNEIPNAIYSGDFEQEFILVPSDRQYRIQALGTDRGTATLVLDEYVDERSEVRTTKFTDIKVESGTQIDCRFGDDVVKVQRNEGQARTYSSDVSTTREMSEYINSPLKTDSSISVSIVDSNDPVNTGEYLEITAELQNNGGRPVTQEVDLIVGHDPELVDSKTVAISSKESTRVSLGYETARVKHTQEFPVRIETDGGSAEQTVKVYGTEDSTSEGSSIVVDIAGTNTPIDSGKHLEVTATIQNTGDSAVQQNVQLIVGHDPQQVDSKTVSVSSNGSTQVSLGYRTPTVKNTQEFPVRVKAGSHTAQQTVKVYGTRDSGGQGSDDGGGGSSSLSVIITGTNAPVNAGNRLTVTARLQNAGDRAVSETVALIVGKSPEQVDSQTISVPPDGFKTVTLSYKTYPAKQDTSFPVRVKGASNADQQIVTVYGTG